jgi:integrating conjugative element protein (TIGR03749 family)
MNAQLNLSRVYLFIAVAMFSSAALAQVSINPLIPAPNETGMLLSGSIPQPTTAVGTPNVFTALNPPASTTVPTSTNSLVPMTTLPDKTLKLPPSPSVKSSTTSATTKTIPPGKAKTVSAIKDPVRAMQDEMPSLDDGVNQRVVWNKVPITVALRVGQERRITLPARMRIAVPPDLSRKLALLLVDDTAYVTATAPFEKIRLIAEDPVRGMVLLMDVSASKNNGSVAPITIHLPSANVREETIARNSANTNEEAGAPDYVTLTRFAAKQIYAPRRLATELPGVATVGYRSVSIKGLYRLGNLDARAIGAWRSDSHYVTAVKLTNLGNTPLELDPREVRGAWLTISFQHGRLLSKGDEADTTVMYLVSDAPFESSL